MRADSLESPERGNGAQRKRIKGVLFDFDGTLTLPGALDFPAIKRDLGCPEEKPILEYLRSLPSARREELMTILELREEEAATKSFPNKGAESCLSALREKGILLGIITRNSLKSVYTALEKFHGISPEDFTVIISREDALPKPHPDGVHQAAIKMGITPQELLVVGDFRFDIMAGNAAGSPTILLQTRDRPVMAAGDPEPDYRVSDLEEILGLL